MRHLRFLQLSVFAVAVVVCVNGFAGNKESLSSGVETLIVVDTIRDPVSNRVSLYTFRPFKGAVSLPCILFCPAFGSDNPIEYRGMIERIVQNGAVVLFPTYTSRVFTRSSAEIGMRTDELFTLALHNVGAFIDTSRIGFVGHSYGAGILPSIVERVIDRQGWGSNGTFLYLMSPWYFPGTSERELAHFPQSCGVLVQVFANDNINDPRIGSNLFQMLKLPLDHKEFCVVASPSGNRKVRADFRVPFGDDSPGGFDNVLDTMALYRTIDSLCEGTFGGKRSAFTFVFGSGITRKIPLGDTTDSAFCMISTDNPKPFLSHIPYVNSWISPRNPFIDVSAFRRARRLYFGFIKQKLGNTISYSISKKKREIFNDTLDIEVIPNTIDSGFGADGKCHMRIDSIVNPRNPGSLAYLYMPDSVSEKPIPFIIVLHGYTGQDRMFFEPYISHLVSRGVAVIYPTYPVLPVASSAQKVEEKFKIVKSGIYACMNLAAGRLDTSRVGVLGQSFGGGMGPAVGWELFHDKKWGQAGAFLFLTAPWYCHGISQVQLDSFPKNVKLVEVIFDDDDINDHQMAVDIFKNIGIPASEKRFVTLVGDSVAGLQMRADHFVPYGTHYIYGQENLLDYYGLYRFCDALTAYTFYGDTSGRRIALGNGDPVQCFMGKRADGTVMRPCRVTSAPEARHAETDYFYPWDNPLNPRLNRE
jgi:acetyl esterase/lipase